ncbi:PRPS15 [Auxenochlorella protothecoides x Auxenochlorella symbiontica]
MAYLAACTSLQGLQSHRPVVLTQVRSSPSVFRTGPPPSLQISARYRGKGTDLSRVPAFQRSPTDSGSSEVQIARLTARVAQLTVHLQEHKKDYASRRGLMQVLSRRKQLLLYLQSTDRPKYEHVLQSLGIRAPKSGSI